MCDRTRGEGKRTLKSRSSRLLSGAAGAANAEPAVSPRPGSTKATTAAEGGGAGWSARLPGCEYPTGNGRTLLLVRDELLLLRQLLLHVVLSLFAVLLAVLKVGVVHLPHALGLLGGRLGERTCARHGQRLTKEARLVRRECRPHRLVRVLLLLVVVLLRARLARRVAQSWPVGLTERVSAFTTASGRAGRTHRFERLIGTVSFARLRGGGAGARALPFAADVGLARLRLAEAGMGERKREVGSLQEANQGPEQESQKAGKGGRLHNTEGEC